MFENVSNLGDVKDTVATNDTEILKESTEVNPVITDVATETNVDRAPPKQLPVKCYLTELADNYSFIQM